MRHCIFKALALIVLASTAPLFAVDVHASNEADKVRGTLEATPATESAGLALRPDTAAEAALRKVLDAQVLLYLEGYWFGLSEAGRLPGSGGGTGTGAELVGPLSAATVTAHGALLASSHHSTGKAQAIGFELGKDIWLRADVAATRDSFTAYARHRQSGRVYAWDHEGMEPWVCENDAWRDKDGILATPAPVNSGRVDLEARDCGGKQIRQWTRLSAVQGSSMGHDETAEKVARDCSTYEFGLFTDCQVFGVTELGLLPGSGRSGKGSELLGPLEQADYSGHPGALLSGRFREGQVCGIGFGIFSGVYLRADTAPDQMSFIVYTRHEQSGRVYALVGDEGDFLICENDDWIGQSGILATTFPVTRGAGTLEGKDCGGKQIRQWRRLASRQDP